MKKSVFNLSLFAALTASNVNASVNDVRAISVNEVHVQNLPKYAYTQVV